MFVAHRSDLDRAVDWIASRFVLQLTESPPGGKRRGRQETTSATQGTTANCVLRHVSNRFPHRTRGDDVIRVYPPPRGHDKCAKHGHAHAPATGWIEYAIPETLTCDVPFSIARHSQLIQAPKR